MKGSLYNYSSWKDAAKPLEPRQLKADVYRWNTAIDFTFLGNAHPYLKSGWSHPEEQHCWTVGKAATVDIPIFRTDSLVSLKASFRTFLAPDFGLDKQTETVLVNGHEIAEWIITEPNFQERIVNIPRRFIKDANSLEITFSMPDAVSPEQLGISKDHRSLGIGVRSLVLSEADR